MQVNYPNNGQMRQLGGRWGRGRGSLPYLKDGGARRNFGKKPLTGQICLEMQVNEVHTLLLHDKHPPKCSLS